MNGIIDTHTHLDSFFHKGVLAETLDAAKDAGLSRMVTVGTDADDWKVYGAIATDNEGFVDFTVGIHPCSVEEGWESMAEEIELYFAKERKPVALGEIGLDRFHLPQKNLAKAKLVYDLQVAAFARQLEIAKGLDCPIVIHSRGAFEDCVGMIDASGVDWTRVVFHCFSEGPGEMTQLMDRGGFGSFTGIITFRSAESVREAAKLQGLDRLMIETDAPYLAPMPHRGKRNEPAYLAHTANYCAEMFGVSLEMLAEKTSQRACGFYRLGSG